MIEPGPTGQTWEAVDPAWIQSESQEVTAPFPAHSFRDFFGEPLDRANGLIGFAFIAEPGAADPGELSLWPNRVFGRALS